MCRLIETLKIKNGILENVCYHNKRLNSSRMSLFGCPVEIDLRSYICIPDEFRHGVFKCRVLYSSKIEFIEIVKYKKREVSSLKLVFSDIEYSHKFKNRDTLNKLLERRGDCDEIMIVKNQMITDSSYSNLAFFDGNKWVTPIMPLLKGTKRQKLIDERMLVEKNIFVSEIKNYEKVSLINAMNELGEIEVNTINIFSEP